MALTMASIGSLLDEKLDLKFKNFKAELSQELIKEIKKEIKSEITNELKDLISMQSKKIEELESTTEMLKSHVNALKEQNVSAKHDDLEQYGRRVCLRVSGIKPTPHETSEDVLEKCIKSWEDCGIQIPDAVIDRAHRLGPPRFDKVTNNEYQSAIIKFTTFRHRTLIYNKRKEIEKQCGYRFRLDLTRDRHSLFKEARDLVKPRDEVSFVYSDVNCRLKVKFADNRAERFFNNIQELHDILNC